MKPKAYFFLGHTSHLTFDQRPIVEAFRKGLRKHFSGRFDLLEMCAHESEKGLFSMPSLPHDGVIIIPVFPLHHQIDFEIEQAMSSVTRQLRPVPVIEFGRKEGKDMNVKLRVQQGFHAYQDILFDPLEVPEQFEQRLEKFLPAALALTEAFFGRFDLNVVPEPHSASKS